MSVQITRPAMTASTAVVQFALPATPLPALPAKPRQVDAALSAVADDGIGIARFPRGELTDLVHSASAIAGWMAAVGGILVTFRAALESPETLPVAAGITAAGFSMLLGACGIDGFVRKLNEKKFAKRQAANLSTIESELATARGTQLAWLGLRTGAIVGAMTKETQGHIPNPVGRPIDEQATARRLRAIAKVVEHVKPEELEVAKQAYALFHEVNDPRSQTHLELERFNARVRSLPADARSLLRDSVPDRLLARIDKEPGNAWRRQRFLDALEGKREDYVTGELDSSIFAFKLPKERVGEDRVVHRADTAVRVIDGTLAAGSSATVFVKTGALAEQIATHYERNGYSAMLRGMGDDVVLLCVYDADNPPERDPTSAF